MTVWLHTTVHCLIIYTNYMNKTEGKGAYFTFNFVTEVD